MLENLKIRVINMARKAQEAGLCREKSGSFSIKDETSGYILITPSRVDREDLKLKDICVLDKDGNVIEKQPSKIPSTEYRLHVQIYKNKPEVKSVMYISSLYATIFAISNKSIPPITQDSKYYGGYVYVAPYEKAETIELAESAIEPLRKHSACLLERHGLVVVSSDIDDIITKAQYVEDAAEIYYKVLLLNGLQEPKLRDIDEFKMP